MPSAYIKPNTKHIDNITSQNVMLLPGNNGTNEINAMLRTKYITAIAHSPKRNTEALRSDLHQRCPSVFDLIFGLKTCGLGLNPLHKRLNVGVLVKCVECVVIIGHGFFGDDSMNTFMAGST